MFFFKRRRAPKPTFSAALAPDEPFFAIGDLHGRDDLLERILPRLAERDPAARVVFVGDYIDRGEQSAQLIRRLQGLAENQAGTPTFLKGNHEDMLLRFLDNPAEDGPRWMRYGGLQTVASFGLAVPQGSAPAEDWEALRDRVIAALGPGGMAWLEALETRWQSGNVCVLHAGADPSVPLSMQADQILLWGHPDFEKTPRSDDVWVVHGHTIVETPRLVQGRIAIDTGAYATGRLTALYLCPGQSEPEFLQV